MKNINNLIITLILKFVGLISLMIGRNLRVKFGKLIGRTLKSLSSKRYNITVTNIMTALKLSRLEAEIIADKSYENLGITLSELLVLEKLTENQLKEYIKFNNLDLISEAFQEGKGVILLSGHFGNWEFLAYCAGLFLNLSITVIVKPQSNKIADKYLSKTRTSGGNKIISMYKAARSIVKELSQGNIIAMLADQSAERNNDVYATFFGRKTPTYSAPAALSLKYQAPIIMGFANRQEDGTYLVDLIRINPYDYDNNDKGIQDLTQLHVDILESEIRKNPQMWAWQHRRWKHSPDKNDD